MNIFFETATTAHLGLLLKLQEAFYAINGYPFNHDTAQTTMASFMANPELGRLYIICQNKEVIGYGALTFCYSFEFGGRIAFLDELFIKADYRHQGIGTQALEYILDKAAELKIRVIHLEAERQNAAGKALYHKFGFQDHDRHLLTKKIVNS